jgi:hypothetical protein
MKVGDKVRNKLTGKVYRLRQIMRTYAVVQRGSTAIRVKIENLEATK